MTINLGGALDICSQAFGTSLYKAGRAAMCEMDLGWESHMIVFNIYGKSGGSKADNAIPETIIDAITKEMTNTHTGPPLF